MFQGYRITRTAMLITLPATLFLVACNQNTYNPGDPASGEFLETQLLRCALGQSPCSPAIADERKIKSVYVAGSRSVAGQGANWWIKKFSAGGVEMTSGWDKSFDGGGNMDDAPTDLVVDSGGNVYVIGTRHNGADRDWWIKKYDADGNEDTTNWNKTIGGVGNDEPTAVAVDANDNVYVAGMIVNADDDWHIKKFSPNGVEDITNWNRTFDTGTTDLPTDMLITDDGSLFVVGRMRNTDADWHIKKFTLDGIEDTVNWNKTLDGGSGGDVAYGVGLDAAGNVYVSGDTKTVAADKEWWLKKFSANGIEDTTNWNKIVSDDPGNFMDFQEDLAMDANGNVYVCGRLRSQTGQGDNWVIKKYSSGGIEDTTNWNKSDDSGANSGEFCLAMAVGPDNSLFAVGTHKIGNADWWIRKYSPDGVEDITNWNKIIDGGIGAGEQATAIFLEIE